MPNLIMLFTFVFATSSIYAQNGVSDSSEVSVSFGTGIWRYGLLFDGQLSVGIHSHIITISGMRISEIQILDTRNPSIRFDQFALLYGQRIKPTGRSQIAVSAGLGYLIGRKRGQFLLSSADATPQDNSFFEHRVYEKITIEDFGPVLQADLRAAFLGLKCFIHLNRKITLWGTGLYLVF